MSVRASGERHHESDAFVVVAVALAGLLSTPACGGSSSGDLYGGEQNGNSGGSVGGTGAVASTGGSGAAGADGGGLGGAGGSTDSGFPVADAAVDTSTGGAGVDAAEVGPPDPGGVPTPNTVVCGAGRCTRPGEVCCFGGLAGSMCLPSFPGCVEFGSEFRCDDAADCALGQACCAVFTGLGRGSSCAASCTGGAVRLCETHADCGAQLCADRGETGYRTCQ